MELMGEIKKKTLIELLYFNCWAFDLKVRRIVASSIKRHNILLSHQIEVYTINGEIMAYKCVVDNKITTTL